MSSTELAANHSAIFLPAEVLLAIFQHVYLAEQDPRQLDPTEIPCSGNSRQPAQHLPSTVNLFPYALTSVSPFWRDVMSMEPHFWTRLVVTLDAHDNTFTEFHRHLMWSRDLPIDVHFAPPQRPAIHGQERWCVEMAMNTLVPHLHRCTAFEVLVNHSSSLPSTIQDALRRDTPKLERLVIESALQSSRNLDAKHQWHLHAPKLKNLSLSGEAISLFARDCQSSHSLISRDLDMLTLFKYDARVGQASVVTLSDVIHSLLGSRIRHLALKHLYLKVTPLSAAVYNPRWAPLTLELEDIQEEVIAAIHRKINGPVGSVTISNSQISSIPRFKGCVLQLDRIPGEVDSAIRALTYWTGTELFLIRCSWVDDTLIEALADEYASETGFMCSSLTHLHIQDCPNISIRALKKMVEKRREAAARDGSWSAAWQVDVGDSTTVRPLRLLDIVGGPRPSERDDTWFKNKLGNFSWSASALSLPTNNSRSWLSYLQRSAW